MADGKINGIYYHLITFGWVAKQLESYIKPRLYRKQTLWEIYILLPNEINHLHYEVTKPNEQHQFHLLYLS